ncbi:MAG: molybdopterin biosynthesis protein [Beijerinckiaceae bacterium]|jgi:putative molybdopterin biosynthesis protein|nr:molybdopterin biosynthesis protein [Beijerinckiaceae bacterium]
MTDHSASGQEQFLQVLSRDEAYARFLAALNPQPLGLETLPLHQALGRVLGARVIAGTDTPPFDRSGVDGFAVRAADLALADALNPVVLRLNDEVLACGRAPRLAVAPGTATPIATGAPLPRGADAVMMIEDSEEAPGGVRFTKAALPGQHVAFAGSDIARGQVLLEPGIVLTARELAMVAAIGQAEVPVWRRPRIAVLSTGDELVPPGSTLGPAQIYDSNGAAIAATLAEAGCEPVPHGIVTDDPELLRAALKRAHAECDAVMLSGGTSKGAGDFTYKLIGELGAPGILAHGVALKPGKPLCLAVCNGKAVVALPGFPSSAMFTLHEIVLPVIRRLGGVPEHESATVEARLPIRLPSELGRTEFVMVALSQTPEGLVAHPLQRGSGAVTAFAQADGFLTIDALSEQMPAQERVPVRLIGRDLHVPTLTIIGSHCSGLDEVISRLTKMKLSSRVVAVGSMGGLAALRRGDCDLAPMHLLHAESGEYNRGFLSEGMTLIKGWRRMQGLAYRKGDARFEEGAVETVIQRAAANPNMLMVNRNSGSGTRILLDGLLSGAEPQGYFNQPRSHHAVAAAIAQGRADWGLTIEPIARAFGLAFRPFAEEHYDFAVMEKRLSSPEATAFIGALDTASDAIRALGFAR